MSRIDKLYQAKAKDAADYEGHDVCVSFSCMPIPNSAKVLRTFCNETLDGDCDLCPLNTTRQLGGTIDVLE